MTRIFFNATIKVVNVVVGEKNMPVRIIFGKMEDVRKEFDAVIIIIATIIVFVIVINVIFVIAVYIVVIVIVISIIMITVTYVITIHDFFLHFTHTVAYN
jgi:hypothetical protein